MKPFSQIKIAATFCAHNDDKYIDLVVHDLLKYTSDIYVNLNDATPFITNYVKKHANIKGWIETTKNGASYNFAEQGKAREGALRLLDIVEPDIVLFPDADETYPSNLLEQLEYFWYNEEFKTFWFRLLYLYNDELHFRNDGIWKSLHHVRIFKWQPDITFIPYPGYACPRTYINLAKNTRYNSNKPVLHWGYKDAEDRCKKFLRAGYDYTNSDFKGKIDKNLVVVELPEELRQ